MQNIDQGVSPVTDLVADTSAEAAASDDSTVTQDAEVPRPRRAPMFIPKQPPPRALKRYELENPPPAGEAVIVTAREGNRTATYQGRVVFVKDGRIRLKEGAGWWDIPLRDIVTITSK
jgi:hypothetical protein